MKLLAPNKRHLAAQPFELNNAIASSIAVKRLMVRPAPSGGIHMLMGLWHVSATFMEKLELHHWPFDSQDLVIRFDFRHPTDQYQLLQPSAQTLGGPPPVAFYSRGNLATTHTQKWRSPAVDGARQLAARPLDAGTSRAPGTWELARVGSRSRPTCPEPVYRR